VPDVPGDPGKLGYFYLVEIEKTRLYLMSQRFVSRDTHINLALVSVDGSTTDISQAITQDQGLECSDINLTEVIRNLGLSASAVQKMPELLHMQMLASGHLVDNLAPESLTKAFQFGRIKRAIKIAIAAVGLLGLVSAAWVFKQALDNKSAYNQAVQETKIQQHRYDEVAKNFPATPISANDLKVAVELDQSIAAYPKSPRRMMQVLSAALAPTAEGPLDNIQLDRLRWVFDSETNIKDDDKLIPVITNSSQPNNANVPVNAPAALHEIALVTAEIAGFTGDYRAALNSVNRFVNNIRADARVASVEVLQEPVNVSSFVDLQGSTTDEQSAQKQPAFFKLKVILKPAGMVTADKAEVKQP